VAMPLSDKERKALTFDPSDYVYQYSISSTKNSWLMVYHFEAIKLDVEVHVYCVDKVRASKVFEYTRHLLSLRSEYILSPEKVFNWCGELWMIFPLHNGCPLDDVLGTHFNNGIPRERITARILLDVVEALEVLHEANLSHGTLSPATLFLEKDTGTTKLRDFLSSKFFEEDDKAKHRIWDLAELAHLRPPETMDLFDSSEKPEEIDERKADIFLFAITAMTLAYGDTPPSPYPLNAVVKPSDWIMPNERTYRHQPEHNISEAFKAMITPCLSKSTKARPSAKELKKDKFFSQAANRSEVKQTICSLLTFLERPRTHDLPPSQKHDTPLKSPRRRDLVVWDRQVETKSPEMDEPEIIIHGPALRGEGLLPSPHESIEMKNSERVKPNTRFLVHPFEEDQHTPAVDQFTLKAISPEPTAVGQKDSGNGEEHTPHDPEARRIKRFHVKEDDGTSSQPAPPCYPIQHSKSSIPKPLAVTKKNSRFKVERVEDVSSTPIKSPRASPGVKPSRPVANNASVTLSKHTIQNTPTFKRKKALEWDVKDVCDWLQSLGGDFKNYTSFFREAGIDGEMLHNMTDDELIELQVNKKIHRRRVLTSIKKLPLDANK